MYIWRTWCNSLFITTVKAAGALPAFKSGHSSRAPAALTVVLKREFHQGLHGEADEIPSLLQHLKLQEPCPLLNLVTLVELLQL